MNNRKKAILVGCAIIILLVTVVVVVVYKSFDGQNPAEVQINPTLTYVMLGWIALWSIGNLTSALIARKSSKSGECTNCRCQNCKNFEAREEADTGSGADGGA
ncbi:MAG: hypothetical protein LBC38_01650 [Oscillospiraceae bacterium]|jgi:uncharacterized membrane protein|nr:hypothetical protein [Oscillospiraceae bacterium]